MDTHADVARTHTDVARMSPRPTAYAFGSISLKQLTQFLLNIANRHAVVNEIGNAESNGRISSFDANHKVPYPNGHTSISRQLQIQPYNACRKILTMHAVNFFSIGRYPGRSGTINGLWCRWLRKSAISGSARVEFLLNGAI